MLDWCENNEQKNNFIIFSIFSDFTDKKNNFNIPHAKNKRNIKIIFLLITFISI